MPGNVCPLVLSVCVRPEKLPLTLKSTKLRHTTKLIFNTIMVRFVGSTFTCYSQNEWVFYHFNLSNGFSFPMSSIGLL